VPTKLSLLVTCIALSACSKNGTLSMPEPERNTHSASAPAGASAASARVGVGSNPGHVGAGTPLSAEPGHELAAFAAGCFWGVEDTFRQVPGVTATAVGYSGGHTDDPTYPSVCTHTTGHAETVLVEFDPNRVSYATLVNVFFKNHDPTTKNRQGPDVGDQYRSEIFTFSAEQAATAKLALTHEQAHHQRPITTAIEPLSRFWKAEEYHQQYDEKTGTHSCPLPKGLRAEAT
jgi:peptide-methionine (S)-S-oxide reductase